MSDLNFNYSSRQEMLESLAESALLPDKFFKIGRGSSFDSYVGSSPMRSSVKVSYGGVDHVDRLGNIVNLGLADQTYLNKGLSEKFGVALRYGSLAEQMKASSRESTLKYRMSSLVPYSVYTGQVVKRSPSGFEVRRVADALFSDNGSKPQLVLGDAVLQRSAPEVSGYCDSLSSEIPIDSEFSADGRLYFGSVIFDRDGLSSVNVSWGSSVLALFGGASPTSQDYHFGTTVTAWTDDDMRK